ncbi:MAG: hypothetical protein ACTSVV_09660 [Promethearchaeota archaeon]
MAKRKKIKKNKEIILIKIDFLQHWLKLNRLKKIKFISIINNKKQKFLYIKVLGTKNIHYLKVLYRDLYDKKKVLEIMNKDMEIKEKIKFILRDLRKYGIHKEI